MKALVIVAASILSAVAAEYLVEKFMKKPITISDGSAVLTGLLMSMCLPPDLPTYMAVIGSFVAIVIAKHSMGGLGYNIFNPAHIARAALMVSWPVAMTTWRAMSARADVIASATPLNILKQQGYAQLVDTFGGTSYLYKAMFLGSRGGSIGETSTILLIVGGIFLIYKKYIKWQVPVLRNSWNFNVGFWTCWIVYWRSYFPYDGGWIDYRSLLYGNGYGNNSDYSEGSDYLRYWSRSPYGTD